MGRLEDGEGDHEPGPQLASREKQSLAESQQTDRDLSPQVA